MIRINSSQNYKYVHNKCSVSTIKDFFIMLYVFCVRIFLNFKYQMDLCITYIEYLFVFNIKAHLTIIQVHQHWLMMNVGFIMQIQSPLQMISWTVFFSKEPEKDFFNSFLVLHLFHAIKPPLFGTILVWISIPSMTVSVKFSETSWL
jgi:hypothetical protein